MATHQQAAGFLMTLGSSEFVDLNDAEHFALCGGNTADLRMW